MGSPIIRNELQFITDFTGFEHLCDDLMYREGYTDLEPLGGWKDKGRDAIVRKGRYAEQQVIFC